MPNLTVTLSNAQNARFKAAYEKIQAVSDADAATLQAWLVSQIVSLVNEAERKTAEQSISVAAF